MANTIDIGDVYRISNALTTTATGAAIDPGALSLVVLFPDGTESTYTYAGGTITKDSTGNYHVDLTITMAGTHRYRWTSTGSGAASEEGWFQVRARKVS